jgi:acyl dehydratase
LIKNEIIKKNQNIIIIMVDQKFIGYEFEASEYEITSWKVSQFANAIRDENPIYFDIEEAKKKGYKDIPIPPTFLTRMTFSGGGAEPCFNTLEIPYKKLLDGGREFKYHVQCYAGDTITYQTKVDNIVVKEGKRGKMDIVTLKTTGENKKTNEKVFDTFINLVVFH